MSEHPSQGPESPDPQLSALIEMYFDEQLSGDAKARFDEELSRRPELRAQLDRQHQIDRSLRAMFVTPALSEALLEQIHQTSHTAGANGRADSYVLKQPSAPTQPPLVRRSLLVAASIAVLVCGPMIGWFAWEKYNEPKVVSYEPKEVRPLDVAYRDAVEAGFKCDWECKTEREFAATFAAQLGQPLLMKALPQQVASLGLAYPGGITPRSVAYMARVADQPVMVFVDRAELDPGQTLSNPRGLQIFKRQIGTLVLYEVTPLENPALLELFYEPEPASGRPMTLSPNQGRRGSSTAPR